MATKIIPPATILGSEFTKLLKVALTDTGRIVVSGYAYQGGTWQLKHAPQEGLLKSGNLSFEMGVPEGGRALFNVDAEIWIDDWFASTQQLVGRHPDNKEFVFGEADYAGGDPNKFSAPGLINTVTKIPGKIAVKLETVPALADGPRLKPLRTRVTTTVINRTTSTVGLVLWLEENQSGYVKFKTLPGLNRPVNISL